MATTATDSEFMPQTAETQAPRVAMLWPRWMWVLLASVAAIDTIWLLVTPLSLSPGSYPVLICLAAIVPMIALMLLRPAIFEPWPRGTAFAAGLGTMMLAWPILRLFNHLMMATDFPLADKWLARADVAIGFDWNAYAMWADHHLLVLTAMRLAYQNLTLYSVASYLLLIFSAKPIKSCSEYLTLFVVNAIACSTIGCLAPALTASVYYDGHIGPFVHIPRYVGVFHLHGLMAMRNDPRHVLNLSGLPGLVAIPSFHVDGRDRNV